MQASSVVSLMVQIACAGAVVFVMPLFLRNLGGQLRNERALIDWFSGIDLIHEGQRWQGGRSQMLAVLTFHKRFGGFSMTLLCVTRSARWFELEVDARWGEVVAWNLQPIGSTQAAQRLDVEIDELKDFWRSLTWPQAVARSGGETPAHDASGKATGARALRAVQDEATVGE